ncbi:gamma-glutamylcyclotransferase family protein [Devosia chinhatensis]|uniref:gamma-glutamylcyclotransferase family protein n=1 Tax=Devosia chinhatensis TaxID=429727 RepID=UPI000695B34E|nr:gamma-glutamylcyclotransferase family protein [Devosia chinhatensis]
MADPLFAYGTLQDQGILEAVLGRPVAPLAFSPASLPHHRVVTYPGRPYPALIPDAGAHASGTLISGLADDDYIALDAFEGNEYRSGTCTVCAATAKIVARVYLPICIILPDAPGWSLTHWRLHHRDALLKEAQGALG